MVAPMLLFRSSKSRFAYGIILNLLISILLFADELYFEYASNILSVMQAGNLQYKDEIIAETEEFNKHFEEEIAKYASDLDQENTVMWLKGVEEDVDFANLSISMPRETNYYILGQGAASEAEVDEEEDAYVVTTDAYTIGYSGTYEGVKDYLNYILLKFLQVLEERKML